MSEPHEKHGIRPAKATSVPALPGVPTFPPGSSYGPISGPANPRPPAAALSGMMGGLTGTAGIPTVGMRPRSFVCHGCGLSVTEERYGQGFKGCGGIHRKTLHMTCPVCTEKFWLVIDVLLRDPKAWPRLQELIDAYR